MPWSATAISTCSPSPPEGDPDRGVLARVVDGVLHQVRHRGGELGVAAVRGETTLTVDGDLDTPGGGRGAGPVDHLGDHPVQRDRLRWRLRLGALQPGQLQQLLHQPAQPGRLVLDPFGEPAGGHQVLGEVGRRGVGRLGRVQQRLGEQLQRADRGLELVADVGHEVASYPGQPVRLGHVDRLDRDEAVAETHRPQVHAERVLARAVAAARQVQLDLAPHAGAAHLAGKGTDQRVRGDRAGGAAGTQQPHRAGGRVDQHGHVVVVRVPRHRPGASRSSGGRARPAARRLSRASPCSSGSCRSPSTWRDRPASAGTGAAGNRRPSRPPTPGPPRPPLPTPPGDRRVIVNLATTQTGTNYPHLRKCSPLRLASFTVVHPGSVRAPYRWRRTCSIPLRRHPSAATDHRT